MVNRCRMEPLRRSIVLLYQRAGGPGLDRITLIQSMRVVLSSKLWTTPAPSTLAHDYHRLSAGIIKDFFDYFPPRKRLFFGENAIFFEFQPPILAAAEFVQAGLSLTFLKLPKCDFSLLRVRGDVLPRRQLHTNIL